MDRASRATRSPALAGALIAVIVLSGCVSTEPAPSPTPAATAMPTRTPTLTPTPTATPDPVLVEGGTAGQNRPYIEFVVRGLLASTPQPASLSIVDALVAAGLDRAAMQVTADTTRVGDPADSILFSVLIDGQCVLGQVAQGAVQTELGEVLGTGRCLIGRTVSLD